MCWDSEIEKEPQRCLSTIKFITRLSNFFLLLNIPKHFYISLWNSSISSLLHNRIKINLPGELILKLNFSRVWASGLRLERWIFYETFETCRSVRGKSFNDLIDFHTESMKMKIYWISLFSTISKYHLRVVNRFFISSLQISLCSKKWKEGSFFAASAESNLMTIMIIARSKRNKQKWKDEQQKQQKGNKGTSSCIVMMQPSFKCFFFLCRFVTATEMFSSYLIFGSAQYAVFQH